MFVLLVLLATYKVCSAAAFYLRVYAPTNIALDYLRSRRGLKWALPASFALAPAYWGIGYAVTTLIETGGPGWLNLLAALCGWNGLKFVMLGIWSPILLIKALLSEEVSARRSSRGHPKTLGSARPQRFCSRVSGAAERCPRT